MSNQIFASKGSVPPAKPCPAYVKMFPNSLVEYNLAMEKFEFEQKLQRFKLEARIRQLEEEKKLKKEQILARIRELEQEKERSYDYK